MQLEEQRVYDFSEADIATLAGHCDELKAGAEALESVLDALGLRCEPGDGLKHCCALRWLSERLAKAVDAFAAWLPKSPCTVPDAKVHECSGGGGSLDELFGALITAQDFVGFLGAEVRAVRFILNGMKAVADRVDECFNDEISTRVLEPVAVVAIGAARAKKKTQEPAAPRSTRAKKRKAPPVDLAAAAAAA